VGPQVERNQERYIPHVNSVELHIAVRRRLLLLALIYGRIPNASNLENILAVKTGSLRATAVNIYHVANSFKE
jgi:hypothetical protein